MTSKPYDRKKENFKFQKIGKEFKEKLKKVFEELVQNYSKANFGTAFKKNEILRKILQNQRKYSQNLEKLSMIFYEKHKKCLRKLWEPLEKFLANIG